MHFRYRCTILGATAEVDLPVSCLIPGDGEELAVDELAVSDARLWVENDQGLYNGLFDSAFPDAELTDEIYGADWEDESLLIVRNDSGAL